MAVKDLQNPERDLQLVDRKAERPGEGRSAIAAAELEALRARIAAVKAEGGVKDEQPHCSRCFERGVKAAVRAIDG